MIVTMDHAGRIVIPKSIRASEGLAAGAELAIRAEAGTIVLEVPVTPVRIELRDGLPLMLPSSPLPDLSSAAVEALAAHQRLRGLGGLGIDSAAGPQRQPSRRSPRAKAARHAASK
jgi:AbrB family looped-hinge helix DNA binding protein